MLIQYFYNSKEIVKNIPIETPIVLTKNSQ